MRARSSAPAEQRSTCHAGLAQGLRTRRYWKQTFEPYRLGLEGKRIHPDGGILGLAWSPSDTKFATASVDHSVRVWDLYTCTQHVRLAGHSSDCTSVDWHPSLALLASGGRDSEVRCAPAPLDALALSC